MVWAVRLDSRGHYVPALLSIQPELDATAIDSRAAMHPLLSMQPRVTPLFTLDATNREDRFAVAVTRVSNTVM